MMSEESHSDTISHPNTIVIPSKILRDMRSTVQFSRNEAGGVLIVDDKWVVYDIKQVFGGTNHVDYDRNLDVQFHTHPYMNTIGKENGGYLFSVPSMYDIILLTLADAYTGKGGKVGFVFTAEAIYTMEVEKFFFTGTTDEELYTYLKYAFYDLYNWCGSQMVSGKSIFMDLDCLNAYLSYARSTHGVKVCRYEWPGTDNDLSVKLCQDTWLLEDRGKFSVLPDAERRKISSSFSCVEGYLRDNWVPDKRFLRS